jgi:hypothetical protein
MRRQMTMSGRALCFAVAVAALLVPWLAPGPAAAQDVGAPRPRVGVGPSAGGLLVGGRAAPVTGAGDAANFLAQMHVGVQVGDPFGVYAMLEGGVFYRPNPKTVADHRDGISGGIGLMFDYTLGAFPFSLGGGGYVGAAAAHEVFVGPRIRGTFYPIRGRIDGTADWRALFLGLDLGVYWPIWASGYVRIAPTLSVGFQRF